MTSPTKKTKKKNTNLVVAKKIKNDEFYTRIEDIENELKHYKDHFKDKVVFCNCDDPDWSNFWRYFHAKFDSLGLKRLVATYYAHNGKSAGVLVCHDETRGKNGRPIIQTRDLKGNGDFRSPECVALLDEADIICTNPPFSLFREFIALLLEKQKMFLVIGDMNASTYKDIFAQIATNRIWLGLSTPSKFRTEVDKEVYKTFGNKCWLTNMENRRRNEEIPLFKSYYVSKEDYPIYENFQAINVNRVRDIPSDYMGVMGVPISFLSKHNPNQFTILGIDRYIVGNTTPNKRFTLDGKEIYARIVIQAVSKDANK